MAKVPDAQDGFGNSRSVDFASVEIEPQPRGLVVVNDVRLGSDLDCLIRQRLLDVLNVNVFCHLSKQDARRRQRFAALNAQLGQKGALVLFQPLAECRVHRILVEMEVIPDQAQPLGIAV